MYIYLIFEKNILFGYELAIIEPKCGAWIELNVYERNEWMREPKPLVNVHISVFGLTNA